MTQTVKVWDPLVRIFHWSLVALFAVAYVTGEDEGMAHIYAGYGITGLVAFRLLWGAVGSRHARFADFVRGPRKTIEYARSLLGRKPLHYADLPLGLVIVHIVGVFVASRLHRENLVKAMITGRKEGQPGSENE